MTIRDFLESKRDEVFFEPSTPCYATMCDPSSSADKKRAMAAVSSISGVGFCSCQAEGIGYRLFCLSF
jgi:hypothetical protein